MNFYDYYINLIDSWKEHFYKEHTYINKFTVKITAPKFIDDNKYYLIDLLKPNDYDMFGNPLYNSPDCNDIKLLPEMCSYPYDTPLPITTDNYLNPIYYVNSINSDEIWTGVLYVDKCCMDIRRIK